MNRLALVLVLLFGCADHQSTTDQPEIQGDACATRNDKTTCAADHGCTWRDLRLPCPSNDSTCPEGVCQISSSGGGNAACTCSNSGVCFEQIGGPAQPAGAPAIQCAAVAVQGNRCPLIANQGHCSASPNVTGLCICDNGIR